MHFFVTGHTGFKGSWLILLLKELGHEVSGYSLAPVEGGLFQLAGLEREVKHHFIGDIRDLEHIRSAVRASQPDFAIHMAAQPLVLRSYEDPIETYTTNVDGTLNFLRAVTELETPPISLVITTDKVYRDDGKGSYVETDPLGGHDPYSASKAMADILTQSWSATNPNLKLHVARAGNVIGAFDASQNRLIPDAVRAIRHGDTLSVRQPNAVRPWQHVLDCLAGYLLLLDKVKSGANIPIALNFGPDPASIRSVAEVLSAAVIEVPELKYVLSDSDDHLKETQLLTLDSRQATSILGWDNQIDFQKAIEWSFEELSTGSALEIAKRQIKEFHALGTLR
jgi:CDP-glucose 4,6-dehydratase